MNISTDLNAFQLISIGENFQKKDEKNYGITASFEFMISTRDDYIRANSKSRDCFLYK